MSLCGAHTDQIGMLEGAGRKGDRSMDATERCHLGKTERPWQKGWAGKGEESFSELRDSEIESH